MKTVLLVTFLFGLTQSLVVNKAEPGFECRYDEKLPKEDIRTEIINLDDAPRDRWKKVANNYRDGLQDLYGYFEGYAGPIVLKSLLLITDFVYPSLPHEYLEEMRGISEVLGRQLNEVVLFNIFYEYFTLCTSVVSLDANGVLYHARNMDFGFFMGWDTKNKTWILPNYLRAITYKAIFVRDGVTVAKTINFAGHIGVLTGISSKNFSLTINERFKANGGFVGIIEWLLGYKSGHFVGFISREALLRSQSYSEAKALLTDAELIAPVYFILGSSHNDGCVITRDRKGYKDIWELDAASKRWFLVQTNYDHDLPPPFFDDRITPGNTCMSGISRKNVNENSLYNVLKTIPIRNKLTVFFVVMVPSTGKIKAHSLHCDEPNCAIV